MILARDITERKQREDRLLQAQKMESLGTLAGGIAHDLNNTLVPVLGLTGHIMQDLPDSSDIRANMEIVAAAAERSHELVEQILKFSRSEEANRNVLDLCSIVRETLPLLRATLPAAIEIHDDIDDADTLTVNADPVQIHQILMNLGSNASQAMASTADCLRSGKSSLPARADMRAPSAVPRVFHTRSPRPG